VVKKGKTTTVYRKGVLIKKMVKVLVEAHRLTSASQIKIKQ